MRKLIILFASLFFFSCNKSSNQKPVKEEARITWSGKKVYETYCVACHGADGKMGFSGAKDLSITQLSYKDRETIITYGKGVMNPFKNVITTEEIQRVAIYLDTLNIK